MRRLMEFAYKMADRNGCPCILFPGLLFALIPAAIVGLSVMLI